jgi:programmed cell death 6-interacting protein
MLMPKADPVPHKSELKPIDRADMAVSRVPKELTDSSAMLSEGREFGKPLFAKLVPFAVHVAANIYDERRDRLVNKKVIEELEILTSQIHE